MKNKFEKSLKEANQKEIQKKFKKAEAKGITLIALVVTIVVLLILAGITISFVLGNGGILNTAQKAWLKTKIAVVEDEANIIYTDLKMQKYVDGSSKGNLRRSSK